MNRRTAERQRWHDEGVRRREVEARSDSYEKYAERRDAARGALRREITAEVVAAAVARFKARGGEIRRLARDQRVEAGARWVNFTAHEGHGGRRGTG